MPIRNKCWFRQVLIGAVVAMFLAPTTAAGSQAGRGVQALQAFLQDFARVAGSLPDADGEDPYTRARVRDLTDKLRSGSDRERAQAGASLAVYATTSAGALDAVIDALGDRSATVRNTTALGVLQEFNIDDGEIAPRVLAEALADPDPEIRADSARQLGRVVIEDSAVGTVRAALEAAGQDPVQRVRRVAARTLRELPTSTLGYEGDSDPADDRLDPRISNMAGANAEQRTAQPAQPRTEPEAPADRRPANGSPTVEAARSVPGAGPLSSDGIPAAIAAIWPGESPLGLDSREQVDAGWVLYSGAVPLEADGYEEAMVGEFSDPARVQEQKQWAREDAESQGSRDEMVELPGAANPGFLSKPQSVMQLVRGDPNAPPIKSGTLFAQQKLNFYCGTVDALVSVQIATEVPWQRGRPGTIYEGGFEYDEAAAEAAVQQRAAQLKTRVVEMSAKLAQELASRGYCR